VVAAHALLADPAVRLRASPSIMAVGVLVRRYPQEARCWDDELMASRVPFYCVDVFATRPLTGNPLSLVPDADGLAEAQIRAIAREFNQSETTFLLRPSLPGATVRLRSFTPAGAEVGGAGHDALGAWLWPAAAGRLASPATGRGRRQEIAGQVLPVEVVREAGQPAAVWMDQGCGSSGVMPAGRRCATRTG
jgi:trans-2,3-dihydro-3-hydroxyanthranilate isomerase